MSVVEHAVLIGSLGGVLGEVGSSQPSAVLGISRQGGIYLHAPDHPTIVVRPGRRRSHFPGGNLESGRQHVGVNPRLCLEKAGLSVATSALVDDSMRTSTFGPD